MSLKTVANPIDEASTAKQVLTNLFYGWGYNFYRKENQLRADDLLIRGKVSDLLGQSRAHIASLQSSYRREHLPPPTREHPVADPIAIAQVQAMQRAQQELEALETKVRGAPVPEMDRVAQRHRNEKDMLEQLVVADSDLVAAAKQLGDSMLALDDAAIVAEQTTLLLRASGIGALCERRAEILSMLIVQG